MDCTKFKEMIGPYIDNELVKEDRVIFEKHVKRCSNCENNLGEMRSLIDTLKSMEEEPLPLGFREDLSTRLNKKHRIRHWMKWAGAIAGTLILLFAIGVIKDLGPLGTKKANIEGDFESHIYEDVGEEEQVKIVAEPKNMESERATSELPLTIRDQSDTKDLNKERITKAIQLDTLEVYVEDICITPQTLQFIAIDKDLNIEKVEEEGIILMLEGDEDKKILYRELTKLGQVKETGEALKDGKVRVVIKSEE